MKSYLYLILISLLLAACSPKKSQNFVFILVDDLGWTDLGYAGSEFYETPNIDKLSKESIKFTNAYSSGSVCSPSRAAIMTGKHPARLQITDWIPGQRPKNRKLVGPSIQNQLPLSEKTLAEAMLENGYKTFYAGKWHLGDSSYFPEDQGFQINKGGHHKGSPPGGYYSPYKNPKLADGPEGEYLTDRLTAESISFLDSVGKDPFFLYLAYYTVHTPIQPNIDYINKFKAKLESLEDPENSFRVEHGGKTMLKHRNAAYASMLYSLDSNIGQLIQKLKIEGLYENTTIVFTSDNGGLSTLANNRNAPTSVEPLRAGKGWLYEGGIRVPLLIKPSYHSGDGEVVEEPVIGHDFYPTLLSITGIKQGSDGSVDGKDLGPLLNGEASLDRDEIFWHYPHYHGSAWTPGAAIRKGSWKLIEFHEKGISELYNLSDDLSEKNNLIMENPEKAAELSSRLHELLNSVNASEAAVNPDFINIE